MLTLSLFGNAALFHQTHKFIFKKEKRMRHLYKLVLLLTVCMTMLSACGTPATTPAPVPTEAPTPVPVEFTFGLLMVGPYNDHGWSQAHYEAGQYVEKNVPGAKMVYVD